MLLGFRTGDRYRSIAEAQIVEMLALMGWGRDAESAAAVQSAQHALHEWVELGLPFRRGAGGTRCFDPVEVNNTMRAMGRDGRHAFFADTYVPAQRRLVSTPATSGPPATATGAAQTFVVDLWRTFELGAIAKGSRLRLTAPLPLVGEHLVDLEVSPFAETAEEVRIEGRPGRLEIRTFAPGDGVAALGAKLRFTARPQAWRSQAAADADAPVYRAEREGLIVVSNRIRRLAHALAPSGMPALETLCAFWEHINGALMSGSVHYDQVDVESPCDWVLDAGWFDCQMGASLLAALCRARGIAARVVGGYLLFAGAGAIHYWAEVAVDGGWTPVDFYGWDLSCGGLDREWRDRFFGRLDYRLTTQRMPREFTGAPGVPIPPAWCVVPVARNGAVEHHVLAIDGTPVYTDTIRVMG